MKAFPTCNLTDSNLCHFATLKSSASMVEVHPSDDPDSPVVKTISVGMWIFSSGSFSLPQQAQRSGDLRPENKGPSSRSVLAALK